MTTTLPAGVHAPAFLPMMEPVLRRGRSVLDRALLPGDEPEHRLHTLLARAADRGLDGVVIFGAAHLPENLVYYANYTPTTFHGALVARAGVPPVLFAGKGGARDHPYIRTVSWVSDIRYAAAIGPAAVAVADSWSVPWQRLGVVGLDTTLPHAVRGGVAAALGDRITDVDDLVIDQRREKSPRELAVLAAAEDLAGRAAEAGTEAYQQGAGRRSALAAADFAARAGGAHDCRISVGAPLGGIAPFSEIRDDRGPLSAVVAAEYLGYWGLAAVRLELDPPDDHALDQAVSGLRPGATVAGALAGAAGTFLVNGLGCGLVEAPAGTDPSAVLRAHDVVSVMHLRPGPHGPELAVRTVVVVAAGARTLS